MSAAWKWASYSQVISKLPAGGPLTPASSEVVDDAKLCLWEALGDTGAASMVVPLPRIWPDSTETPLETPLVWYGANAPVSVDSLPTLALATSNGPEMTEGTLL